MSTHTHTHTRQTWLSERAHLCNFSLRTLQKGNVNWEDFFLRFWSRFRLYVQRTTFWSVTWCLMRNFPGSSNLHSHRHDNLRNTYTENYLCSFIDFFSDSVYIRIASNDRTIKEYYTGKDGQGSCCGLRRGTIPALVLMDWANYDKPLHSLSGGRDLKTGLSKIRSGTATHLIMLTDDVKSRNRQQPLTKELWIVSETFKLTLQRS